MTKHSRMKRQRIRGGAREARARDALGRKIIVNKADCVGIEISNVLAAKSIQPKLFCVKQPYFIWLRAGAPLTGYRKPKCFI